MSASATPTPAVASLPQGEKVTAFDAMARLCDGPDAIPLEVSGSRHFVKVLLEGPNGKEEARFHVDTGGNTPGLMLDKDVAEGVGFRDAASLPRSVILGGRSMSLPAGASWTLFVDDVSRQARKAYSTGQIGAGFLSRYIVCIDPMSGKLGLGDPGKMVIDGAGSPVVGSALLMMMKGGANGALYPFVHVLLEAKGAISGGYGLLLDTGATTSMLDTNKIKYQHEHNPAWPYVEGAAGDSDMIGSAFPEALIRAETVKINTIAPVAMSRGLARPTPVDAGPALFVSRPTGTWDRMFGSVPFTMGSHGALANDVLDRFRILIDYPGQRLFLVPSHRAEDTSASMVRLGISVRFDPQGCPEIRAISSTNADASKKALKVGDTVLSVDGKNTCTMMHHELMTALAGKVGDVKRVTVRRDNTQMTMDVKVVDLLAAPIP